MPLGSSRLWSSADVLCNRIGVWRLWVSGARDARRSWSIQNFPSFRALQKQADENGAGSQAYRLLFG